MVVINRRLDSLSNFRMENYSRVLLMQRCVGPVVQFKFQMIDEVGEENDQKGTMRPLWIDSYVGGRGILWRDGP